MRKRSEEEVIKLVNLIHNNKYEYDLANYKNKCSKIAIICPLHGLFYQMVDLHLKGSGCPKCAYLKRGELFKKSKEKFINDANIVHDFKFSYEKFNYVNAHTKGVITCPIHGDFEQSPNDHLNGRGCPKCKQSHLEREIEIFLKNNHVEYEFQKRFEWLGKQSIDFYLPKYNIAIECQGKQHFGLGYGSDNEIFNKILINDEKKNKLCRENNINLLYYIGKENKSRLSNFELYNNSKDVIFSTVDKLKEILFV